MGLSLAAAIDEAMMAVSKFQRHLVIPLMLTCFLSGCYKWSAQTTPATVAEPPEHARITLDDGRVVELRELEIRGDSVAGLAKEESSRTAPASNL